jgi:hypothetical protein
MDADSSPKGRAQLLAMRRLGARSSPLASRRTRPTPLAYQGNNAGRLLPRTRRSRRRSTSPKTHAKPCATRPFSCSYRSAREQDAILRKANATDAGERSAESFPGARYGARLRDLGALAKTGRPSPCCRRLTSCSCRPERPSAAAAVDRLAPVADVGRARLRANGDLLKQVRQLRVAVLIHEPRYAVASVPTARLADEFRLGPESGRG